MAVEMSKNVQWVQSFSPFFQDNLNIQYLVLFELHCLCVHDLYLKREDAQKNIFFKFTMLEELLNDMNKEIEVKNFNFHLLTIHKRN